MYLLINQRHYVYALSTSPFPIVYTACLYRRSHNSKERGGAQSRQITRLLFQSSELAPPPPPLPHQEASVSPPFGSGGGGTP